MPWGDNDAVLLKIDTVLKSVGCTYHQELSEERANKRRKQGEEDVKRGNRRDTDVARGEARHVITIKMG